MNKLLEKEPVMRMTSPNAIKDPFFKTEGYNDMERNDRIDLDKQVLASLTNYKSENHLKKAAIHLLVRECDQDQFKNLQEQFEMLDKD